MKLIAEGAEASVYLDQDKIIKKRHKKGYRISELDSKLRLFRTKREAKIMDKLRKIGIAVPKIVAVKDKATTIEMEFVEGEKLRDVLKSNNCSKLGEKIGEGVAVMHDNDIIHGDLTTSNMILNEKIYFVDFGLGFFSKKLEDKAVDLHLLKQALNSSHSEIAGKCFAAVVKEYEKRNGNEVLKRLEKVENRGKYKGKKK